MINLPLIVFLIIIFIIIYNDPTNNTYDTNQLLDWYDRAKYFKIYNTVEFNRLRSLLKQYRLSIKTIKTLDWSRLVKHKQMLPIITHKAINCFHSIVHSLPPYELGYFDQLLKELEQILSNLSYQTILEFYQLNPHMRDRISDYEINLTPDWYLNYHLNPNPIDPFINYHYDWI